MTPVTEPGFDSDLITNANDWPLVVTLPLRFRSVVLDAALEVPIGTTSDLASIPWLAQLFIPKHGKHNRAAVVHDWLYQFARIPMIGDGRPVSRREADRVLYEAMRCTGVRATRAWAIYQGCRLGAWVAWRRYRRKEQQYGSHEGCCF